MENVIVDIGVDIFRVDQRAVYIEDACPDWWELLRHDQFICPCRRMLLKCRCRLLGHVHVVRATPHALTRLGITHLRPSQR